MFNKQKNMNNRKNQRPIDKLANESYGWLNKSWTFIKKKELRWWQTAFILAFLVGVFVAIIMIVRVRVETSSVASGEQAVLSVSTVTVPVNVGDSFTSNIVLDTKGSNVVAVTAIVNYNTSDVQFESYDPSSSIFLANNTCVYNGLPCQIIDNMAGGKISFTFAKPRPGVNTASGNVIALNFKALKAVSSSPISISFTTVGDYADSNVVLDDGKGTDILASVANASVAIAAPVTTCTSFTYSNWGTCSSSGTQIRSVATSTPSGCTGGSPVLSQTCTPPPTTCTLFTYSAWGDCQSDSTQTRTVTASSPSGCTGGTPTLKQSCTYTPPVTQTTCTSFSYSAWSKCTSGAKMRTVKSSIPSGCTGGSPSLSSSCSTGKK